jgi:hypothetical protein
MGRDRKYRSNAERQRAYRARLAAEDPCGELRRENARLRDMLRQSARIIARLDGGKRGPLRGPPIGRPPATTMKGP